MRDLAAAIDPWTLYRVCGRWRGNLIGFYQGPPVVITFEISPMYNLVLADGLMLNVGPDDIEPCEPPGLLDRVGILEVPVRIDGWMTEH